MTAHDLGVEISCDGPARDVGCPDSAAVRASFNSLTAAEVRADGRAQGWARLRRGRRLVDLCPVCKPAPERTSP